MTVSPQPSPLADISASASVSASASQSQSPSSSSHAVPVPGTGAEAEAEAGAGAEAAAATAGDGTALESNCKQRGPLRARAEGAPTALAAAVAAAAATSVTEEYNDIDDGGLGRQGDDVVNVDDANDAANGYDFADAGDEGDDYDCGYEGDYAQQQHADGQEQDPDQSRQDFDDEDGYFNHRKHPYFSPHGSAAGRRRGPQQAPQRPFGEVDEQGQQYTTDGDGDGEGDYEQRHQQQQQQLQRTPYYDNEQGQYPDDDDEEQYQQYQQYQQQQQQQQQQYQQQQYGDGNDDDQEQQYYDYYQQQQQQYQQQQSYGSNSSEHEDKDADMRYHASGPGAAPASAAAPRTPHSRHAPSHPATPASAGAGAAHRLFSHLNDSIPMPDVPAAVAATAAASLSFYRTATGQTPLAAHRAGSYAATVDGARLNTTAASANSNFSTEDCTGASQLDDADASAAPASATTAVAAFGPRSDAMQGDALSKAAYRKAVGNRYSLINTVLHESGTGMLTPRPRQRSRHATPRTPTNANLSCHNGDGQAQYATDNALTATMPSQRRRRDPSARAGATGTTGVSSVPVSARAMTPLGSPLIIDSRTYRGDRAEALQRRRVEDLLSKGPPTLFAHRAAAAAAAASPHAPPASNMDPRVRAAVGFDQRRPLPAIAPRLDYAGRDQPVFYSPKIHGATAFAAAKTKRERAAAAEAVAAAAAAAGEGVLGLGVDVLRASSVQVKAAMDHEGALSLAAQRAAEAEATGGDLAALTATANQRKQKQVCDQHRRLYFDSQSPVEWPSDAAATTAEQRFSTTMRNAHAHAGPVKEHPMVVAEQRRREARAERDARKQALAAAAAASAAAGAGQRQPGQPQQHARVLTPARGSQTRQPQQQQQQQQQDGLSESIAFATTVASAPAVGDADQKDADDNGACDSAAADAHSHDGGDYGHSGGDNNGYEEDPHYDHQQYDQSAYNNAHSGGPPDDYADHHERGHGYSADAERYHHHNDHGYEYGDQGRYDAHNDHYERDHQHEQQQKQRRSGIPRDQSPAGHDHEFDAFQPFRTSQVYGAHTEGAVHTNPYDGQDYLVGSAYVATAAAAAAHAHRGRVNTFGTTRGHPLRRADAAAGDWAEDAALASGLHPMNAHMAPARRSADSHGHTSGHGAQYVPSHLTQHHNSSAAAPPFGVESAEAMRTARVPALPQHSTASGDAYGTPPLSPQQQRQYHQSDDSSVSIVPAYGHRLSDDPAVVAAALSAALAAPLRVMSSNIIPPPPIAEEPFHIGRMSQRPEVISYTSDADSAAADGESSGVTAQSPARSRRSGITRVIRTYRANDPLTMGQARTDSVTTGAPPVPGAVAANASAADRPRLPAGRGLLPSASPVMRQARPIGHSGSMLQLLSHVLPAAGVTTPIDYGADIMTNSDGWDERGRKLQGRLCADQSGREGHAHPVVALMRDGVHRAPLTGQAERLRRPSGAEPVKLEHQYDPSK